MATNNNNKDGELIASYLQGYADKAKTMARTIVIAIIGTCWSMSYNEGVFAPAEKIKISILCCTIYLFLDVLFYFVMTVAFKLVLTHYFKPISGGYEYKRNGANINGANIKRTTRVIHEICLVWILAMMFVLLVASWYLIIHVWSLT